MSSLRRPTATLLGALALLIAGCGDKEDTGEAPREAAPSVATTPRPTANGTPATVARDLEVPWDIAFLPGGDAIVSERDTAKLIRIPAGGGAAEDVGTVPGVVPGGEGGLLGLAVSPDYEEDGLLYAYFTAERDNRIASFALDAAQPKAILTGLAKGQIHNGGALEFGPDGKLYAGVGETGDPGLAQNPDSLSGKILRINPDGSVPRDNPQPGSPIWSMGHRNVQGLTWDQAGRLWAPEFGQETVDEVNLIKKGGNYGWPEVEGKGDTGGGKYTNPVVTWTPTSSSSPSGAAIVGDTLYVGALAGRTLWKIALDGTDAGKPEALFQEQFGRIRGVAKGPNGDVWFTTSNRDGRGEPADTDDRVLRLAD